MDKTDLVKQVGHLFEITGHKVQTSVKVNHREIDVVAEELTGLARKTILIECADYAQPVGVDKLQTDLLKLRSALDHLKGRAIIMHVSRLGYSPEANGYANDEGIATATVASLTAQMINFGPYIDAVSADPVRSVILREYQPTHIHPEGRSQDSLPAIDFFDRWLASNSPWLTVLGDYGVGKSWTLRRFLYELLERYKKDPSAAALPLFIPLQRFTKAFDFQNLILKTFQMHGLGGVHYPAFEYLAKSGRILFLLDSFDEMAQVLSRDVLRENLKEILNGLTSTCRAIMTSRPTYFERRAERLLVVDRNGTLEWHALDDQDFAKRSSTSRAIQEQLEHAQFARLNDLTPGQRRRLFRIVLGTRPDAYNILSGLYVRFQELETISQRAVIARLLTTVAETIATASTVNTIDGYPLLPNDLQHLNQGKIFEIVVYNLLNRDTNIGLLSAGDRLMFLRNFALYLQSRARDVFAGPDELYSLVERIFGPLVKRSDVPQQQLENFYRTCRRHSGLTTEGQFLDTSGNIDAPVDENDTESRVGFSHNSLREYLVAEAISDYIRNGTHYADLGDAVVTELISEFVVDMAEYQPDLVDKLGDAYRRDTNWSMRQNIFSVIYGFVRRDPRLLPILLGEDLDFYATDVSDRDLSGLDLRRAIFDRCSAFDTDFRKSDLRGARFGGTLLFRVMLDDAVLVGADFTQMDTESSIYVMDNFDTRTSGVNAGQAARQWLFTRGAKVYPTDDLNPLLGQPWYEAAREVTRTLERRIAGTHQDVSLSKGTHSAHRGFARDFVDFLVQREILRRVGKSRTGPGHVVKVNPKFRSVISDFSVRGVVAPELEPFFYQHLANASKPKPS
jgi:hypothetical protein